MKDLDLQAPWVGLCEEEYRKLLGYDDDEDDYDEDLLAVENDD